MDRDRETVKDGEDEKRKGGRSDVDKWPSQHAVACGHVTEGSASSVTPRGQPMTGSQGPAMGPPSYPTGAPGTSATRRPGDPAHPHCTVGDMYD